MAVVEQVFPALTWRIRHLAMYPDQPLDAVKLEKDFEGTHFGIYEDYELTGVVSLFTDDTIGQFRKMAVLPQAQHKGLGTQLLSYLIDYCKVQKLTKLWCNARVNVTEFYTKFGFVETDQTYSSNGIDFVRMELELIITKK